MESHKIAFLEALDRAALELPGASNGEIHERALKLLQFHGEKFPAIHVLDGPLFLGPDELLA